MKEGQKNYVVAFFIKWYHIDPRKNSFLRFVILKNCYHKSLFKNHIPQPPFQFFCAQEGFFCNIFSLPNVVTSGLGILSIRLCPTIHGPFSI